MKASCGYLSDSNLSYGTTSMVSVAFTFYSLTELNLQAPLRVLPADNRFRSVITKKDFKQLIRNSLLPQIRSHH